MVRSFWEFMSKEAKARLIFGLAILGVILLIAVPYFINAIRHHSSNYNVNIPEVETSSVQPEATEEAKPEPVAEEQKPSDTEPAAEPATTESTTSYAYNYAPAPVATSQPATQASAPVETVTRTTVDDNSTGDDGYTFTGIDNPGADDSIPTDIPATDDSTPSEV